MGFNVRKSMGVTTVVTKGEGFGRDFCGIVNGLREEEGESFVSSMWLPKGRMCLNDGKSRKKD